MGFDEALVQRALAQAGGDEQGAIEILISGQLHSEESSSLSSSRDAPLPVIFSMGFDDAMVRRALATTGGDEERAVHLILSGRLAPSENSSVSAVEVAADEAGAACLGTFRPANLCVIEECASSNSGFDVQAELFRIQCSSRIILPFRVQTRITIHVDAADCIFDIKQKIQHAQEINFDYPPDEQNIFYLGRLLGDGCLVTECGLQRGSVLNVLQRSTSDINIVSLQIPPDFLTDPLLPVFYNEKVTPQEVLAQAMMLMSDDVLDRHDFYLTNLAGRRLDHHRIPRKDDHPCAYAVFADSESSLLKVTDGNDDEFRLVANSSGMFYVLPHNSKYKIAVKNPFKNCKCDCSITIDGVHVGSWTLGIGQSFSFERPRVTSKKFTFMRTALVKAAETAARSQADGAPLTPDQKRALELAPTETGITGPRKENGVVRVTYTPEKFLFDSLASHGVSSGDVMLLVAERSLVHSRKFCVLFKLMTGGIILLVVKQSDTIEDLVNRIVKTRRMNRDLRVSHGGRRLEETWTLADCGLTASCELCIIHRLSGGAIFGVANNIVRVCSGNSIEFASDPLMTVKELKLFIQTREGILPEQQRLIYSGIELEDYRTLSSYQSSVTGMNIHLVWTGTRMAAGATTLHGDSNQIFDMEMDRLSDLADSEWAIERDVRLVCDANEEFQDRAAVQFAGFSELRLCGNPARD